MDIYGLACVLLFAADNNMDLEIRPFARSPVDTLLYKPQSSGGTVFNTLLSS